MKPRNLTLLLIAALVVLALAFLSGLAVGLTLWVPTDAEIAARCRLRAERAAIDRPHPALVGEYVLQAGSFADLRNARRLSADLQNRGYATRILQVGQWHVVQTGRFPDAAAASRAASEFTLRERLTALVRRAEGM